VWVISLPEIDLIAFLRVELSKYKLFFSTEGHGKTQKGKANINHPSFRRIRDLTMMFILISWSSPCVWGSGAAGLRELGGSGFYSIYPTINQPKTSDSRIRR
jgi:hypothetical protein